MPEAKNVVQTLMLIVHFILIPVNVLIAIWKSITMGKGKSLNKQTVLITGAGNGLGREISMQLIRQGCNVIGVDIREEDLKDTKELVGNDPRSQGNFDTFVCDISNRKQVAKLGDDVSNKYGGIDILINNASLLYGNEYDTGEEEHIEKVCNVNILGGLWVTRAFLPAMKKSGKGHIVYISSASAIWPHQHLTMYSATKCATSALATTLRASLLEHNFENIKVTTVYPTVIVTSAAVTETYEQKRAPAMSLNFAAKKIILAIRNELEDALIPGFLIGYTITKLIALAPKGFMKAVSAYHGAQFRPAPKKVYNEVFSGNKSYKTIYQEHLDEKL